MPNRLNPDRLAELQRTLAQDGGPQRAFDDITRALAGALAVPITMVNLLDAEQDLFKSCFGIQQAQSPAVTSFCEAFFSTSADVIVAEDTLLDERFKTHPKVVGSPFVRFYAAARLVVRGHTLGTLCAYDVVPRTLDAEQLAHLRTMAAAAVELLSRDEAAG